MNLEKLCVFSSCFIVVKRHHDHSTSDKEKHLIGAGLQFRGLVHYHHGKRYGGMQAHTVLEKELGVLQLDLQEAKRNSEPH